MNKFRIIKLYGEMKAITFFKNIKYRLKIDESIIGSGKVVEFNSTKYLTFVRELGRGGTGQTLLFKDEITDTLLAI